MNELNYLRHENSALLGNYFMLQQANAQLEKEHEFLIERVRQLEVALHGNKS